ncbi:hypothetical protein RBD99_002799 [Salmonella enterica]|nr:hypothetical protein [Salmonella enterica]
MAYLKLPAVVDINSTMIIREVYGPDGEVALKDIRVITRPRRYEDKMNPRASYMMADVVDVDGTTRPFGFGYPLDREFQFYDMVSALNAIIKGTATSYDTTTNELTVPESVANAPEVHNLIMYHGDCVDGMAAAWVARTWAIGRKQTYDLIPVYYGKPIPKVSTPEGKEIRIHILDFSYPIEKLQEMVAYYNPTSVIYIDHHATAEKDLMAADLWLTMSTDIANDVRFDGHTPGVSGAVLAWRTYFPESDMPESIIRVGDRDTWRFKYEESKDFHPFAALYLNEPDRWDFVFLDHFFNTNCMQGCAIRQFTDSLVDKYSATDKLRQVEDNGAKGFIINFPREFVSDLCSSILDKNPGYMFAMAYQCNVDHWKFDLRSRNRDKENQYDCGEVCRLFGGGGHVGAGGIVVPRDDTKTLRAIEKYFGFTL